MNDNLNLIFIGTKFYFESGTRMSSIYDETDNRSDWGFVQVHLSNGGEVHIRPATSTELAYYQVKLDRIKEAEKK